MIKNINKIFILALLLLSFNILTAQTKLLQLDDLLKNRKLYASQLTNIQWMGESDNFTWVANNKLVKGSVVNNQKDTILDITPINKELIALKEKEIKRFPTIIWVDKNNFTFIANNKLYDYDVSKNKIEILNKYPEKAEHLDFEPNKNHIAYTIDNNLYISYRGTDITVTEDKEKGIKNGHVVSRDEFGIKKGTFWSPKGNFLAYYRLDETMVTDYPIVDIETRVAEVKNTKYPMAGMKSQQVTLGVFDPVTQKTIFLKTGEPLEQYLTNITWSPDEKYVYIAVLNRDQNHMKLNKYDAVSGNLVKTLFEEKNERYVEPQHGLYFLKTKPDQFIWMSERDGYNHLYLYDTEGKLIKQITKGNWIVKDIEGFDKNDSKVYFTATKESPLDNDLYSIDVKSGTIKLITNIRGTHTPILNKDMKYAIDIYYNTETAVEYLLLNTEGKTLQKLHLDKNPLKDYKLGEMSIFTIKASDDKTDLYCRLIKPINFDQNKKYPVIVYVYGGPHEQLIGNGWLGKAGLFLNYLAEQGYVIFTVDSRGSANRGFEFESCIHRNLGTIEVADQMKGIDYLKTLSYVDQKRIGVDGWSYGGFMTISLMLKNPGVFKVGTAGGPVIDWKWYEVMYGERYMDTPEQNPEGYKNASLLNYADKLQGKLLIMHGTSDPTVVWQNSLSFIKKCVDEGKQLDYFVYPGHEHNVSGMDRVHLYKKISDYFKENL